MATGYDGEAPTPSPGLRERARERRRAAMVDAALTLFAHHGYNSVTVADICAAAEVSPRTFFRYFATKDDVLAEPTREMYSRLVEAIGSAPNDLDDAAVLARAFTDLGDHVIGNRERLLTFVRITGSTDAALRQAFGRFFTLERDLARHLVRRRDEAAEPSWQARLLTGRALTGFRIWLDDVLLSNPPDPHAHLVEILSF
ncbi:MAG: TetR family transcriptional regulator [Gordonia sp. (in: high G+C Gram-positive bacteria)]